MSDRPTLSGFRFGELTYRQQLLVLFLLGLATVILIFTATYYWGMRTLEDRPRTVFQAFNTVIETMTTTGYGADSPWKTPMMNLFVASMQISGVVIGFVTLRVLVIPLFERTPVNLDDQLTVKNDHIVVAEYRRDTGLLLDELEDLDVEYVLLESDREEAKALSDDGYQVIDGDPERRADLDRASIADASLLITDTEDRTASVVLTALEANEDLRVISFTPSVRRKAALAKIGVDRSVAPHALIGQRLAEKATMTVATDALDDETIAVREILVRRDSTLHGVRLGDSPVVTHTDLTLIGGWFDGELRLSPSLDERITPNTVLVVAGPESTIAELANEVAGVQRRWSGSRSRVVVAGVGEGGSAALNALPEDVSATTVDATSEADVVGDVTEPAVLQDADIEAASALIVTVNDDATTLLTVAMARSLAPETEILVRVTDAEKAVAAFRAGADYALSVQRTSARLVAAEVHGERVMDPVSQIRLVRADGAPFAGEALSAVRRDTDRGWTVVGLIRDGVVLTDGETTIEPDDEVFVAGSDAAIQAFEATVDAS